MKKVIIVGAGIAGLTAGIYALQNGSIPLQGHRYGISGETPDVTAGGLM
ncbi:MAG: hypothetical protein PHC91_10985 [Eubacteriales bacterium]|nr:hypothetical protein [Eubacteriales bacterium]